MNLRTFLPMGALLGACVLSASSVLALEMMPTPKLTGKECLRNFCLGDELGKFPPGTLNHGLPKIRLDAMVRKPAEVQKRLAPMLGDVSPELLEQITFETHTTQGTIGFTIPITPVIHEGLLKGPVRVCDALDLVTRATAMTDGVWTVTFRAVPKQQVDGRQAWILTSVESVTPGVYTDEQVQSLRQELKGRAPGYSDVYKSYEGLVTRMAWKPFIRKGATLLSDIQMPGSSNEMRVLYGCLQQSALPKF